ncbi:HipA family kinase [Aquisphaera insulae]|uniref:HipA family kinase n=1 Tax=Aquisphaera insulae TaxID=2712864 RepID=UPI0013EE2A87|nr:HipA family kinase [Aquisphaera insulae]
MSHASPGEWRPTEIRRFIRNFDTGTEAVLVLTDAGEGYLKAMGNAGGEHCLACEWVATHLARWFKLETFDFSLIDITDLDEIPLSRSGNARPGPAFITRAEFGEPWGGKVSELKYLINPGDISRLVVFDTWILNCDRHAPEGRRRPNYNNVFLSREAPEGYLRLKAMDHTHAFTCGHDLTQRVATIDRIQDPNAYGLFPGFRRRLDQDAFQSALDDLRGLPRPFVEEVIRSVPEEWEVGREAREALSDFIVRRAHFLATNRAGIMGIHLNQGRLNLPAEGEAGP